MKSKIEELIEAVRSNRKYSVWTKEQDIDTYSKGLKEEVDEILNAIDKNDKDNLTEEIGDTLWDLFTLMIICEDKYGIKNDEIIDGVLKKFKNRKPHIFEKKIITRDEEHIVWNEAKNKEKIEKQKKAIVKIK